MCVDTAEVRLVSWQSWALARSARACAAPARIVHAVITGQRGRQTRLPTPGSLLQEALQT